MVMERDRSIDVVNRTLASLRRNNFDAVYVSGREEALRKVGHDRIRKSDSCRKV